VAFKPRTHSEPEQQCRNFDKVQSETS